MGALLLAVPVDSFVGPNAVRAPAAKGRIRGAMHCTLSKTDKLRQLLNRKDEILIMPCAYDALSARLIELHGFDAMFMTGFGVAGVRGVYTQRYHRAF